jgi:hypothetical protein
MKKMRALLALLALSAAPAAALAQDANPFWADLAGTRSAPAFQVQDPPARGRARDREVRVEEEWSTPRTQLILSIQARVDFPGGGDVTVFGDRYSDIFDIGYGFNGELSLISWVHPFWGVGPYLSIGWDRFEGTSHYPLPADFFSFNTWDQETFIVGVKVVERVSPFFFWEGRMGAGVVHFGELTFTDELTNEHNLQFFRPITRAVFDFGGRVAFGNPRITFDLGMDFRFMGPASRGRDVNENIDPEVFFVFALDLGLSLRF